MDDTPKTPPIAHHSPNPSPSQPSRIMQALQGPSSGACHVPFGESSWRLFRIVSEFVSGFELMNRVGLAVTFFGSARTPSSDPDYQSAYRLAAMLAQKRFAIVTGGGGGIMEAANRGAYDAGGVSVGLNVELPHEQQLNHYTTDAQSFHYFFIRKVMLTYASEAFVFYPGGFGTLDELFEILTLVQTRKVEAVPIILVRRHHWIPLIRWFEEELAPGNRFIDQGDTTLYTVVEDEEEALDALLSRPLINR